GVPDTARGVTSAAWVGRGMAGAGVGIEVGRRVRCSGRLGRGVKGELAEARRRVWALMRRPMPVTGLVMSYPEIAMACGLTSHSTVHEALNRRKAGTGGTR